MPSTTRQRRRGGAAPRGRTGLRLLLTFALTAFGLVATGAPAQANEYYNSITTASAANRTWMAGVPNGTSLARMSIPGTHDSLALCGSRPGGSGPCEAISTSITRTQEPHGYSAETLTTQLDAGIRSIDIRVRVDWGKEGLAFTVHHGAMYQYANFTDVLAKSRDFLSAHPKETILLNLKAECTGETLSCKDADGFATDTWRKKVFDSYLQGRAYTGEGERWKPATAWQDLFWGPSVTGRAQADTPSLGEVRGKIVLLGFRGTGGGIYDGYGVRQLYPAGGSYAEYVQDEYEVPSISHIAEKWEKVRVAS
ncbi:phosphatidylinositol-specific phospholipase C domain-containing protein [Streptomyces chrestomyceticus]|uniref:phosphatidylinositol-specific phospholipase C domain-containing protein n=1 Tax=Streptomyces chrestomyceticus TaxID=68185 RepID=UPI0019D18BCF|nr:phosphatidylinositol-specific phospholipase C domain-containing protein [Streptomyces chrestomyceticus]